jgi:hypothetical protein
MFMAYLGSLIILNYLPDRISTWVLSMSGIKLKRYYIITELVFPLNIYKFNLPLAIIEIGRFFK